LHPRTEVEIDEHPEKENLKSSDALSFLGYLRRSKQSAFNCWTDLAFIVREMSSSEDISSEMLNPYVHFKKYEHCW
jgi:hypothetical protein